MHSTYVSLIALATITTGSHIQGMVQPKAMSAEKLLSQEARQARKARAFLVTPNDPMMEANVPERTLMTRGTAGRRLPEKRDFGLGQSSTVPNMLQSVTTATPTKQLDSAPNSLALKKLYAFNQKPELLEERNFSTREVARAEMVKKLFKRVLEIHQDSVDLATAMLEIAQSEDALTNIEKQTQFEMLRKELNILGPTIKDNGRTSQLTRESIKAWIDGLNDILIDEQKYVSQLEKAAKLGLNDIHMTQRKLDKLNAAMKAYGLASDSFNYDAKKLQEFISDSVRSAQALFFLITDGPDMISRMQNELDYASKLADDANE